MLRATEPGPLTGAAGQEDERVVGALPPPPEVGFTGESTTLLWRPPTAAPPRPEPARHPLLCVAAYATAGPAERSKPEDRLSRVLRRLRQQLPALRGAKPIERPAPPAVELGSRVGHPLVLVVAGGKGGSGRTTLAIELASALMGGNSSSRWRILVVDADSAQPDMDLKLGTTDLEVDRFPNARIDRVLLNLPELADGRLHIESLVWTDPRTGVRALLAPEHAGRTEGIGREHLDYLFTHMLAPAFDAVVVDAGQLIDCTPSPLMAPAKFWLGLADTVLVPLRPSAAHVRAALQSVRLVEGWGVATERSRLVMGVERSEAAIALELQRGLGDHVVVRWPWVADTAKRAAPRHRPLIETDRRYAEAMAALLPDLASAVRGRELRCR